VLTYCALVVAIEFPVPDHALPAQPHSYFERALAQPLANQLAFELGKQLPTLDGLGLVWMAACFDQAQILRPGFPIHRTLAELYSAGMRDNQAPQVMTLQALRGQAPHPELAVDTRLLGGPMLLLPLALVGSAERVEQARAVLEEKLLDTGLTDARTALMLNQALQADAEHARLMTLDDLAALCAVQLQHAGLDGVWEILEAALFRPHVQVECQIGNSVLRYRDAAVSAEICGIGTLDLPAFAAQTLLLRQALGLLQAHAIPVQQHFVASGILEQAELYWLDWQAPKPPTSVAAVAEIVAFESPSVGVLCYLLHDQQGQLCGHAYPVAAGAQQALRSRFSDAQLVWQRID
jgi:hypothetical protein